MVLGLKTCMYITTLFLPETAAECCSVWHIKLSLNPTLYFLRMKWMQLIVLLLSTTFFFLNTLKSQSTIKKKMEKKL